MLQLTTLCESSTAVALASWQRGKSKWPEIDAHCNTRTHTVRSSWVRLLVLVVCSVFLTHFRLWMHHRVLLVPPVSDEPEKSLLTNSPQPPTALSAWGWGDSSHDYTGIVAQPDTIHLNRIIMLTNLPAFIEFTVYVFLSVYVSDWTGGVFWWHLFRWGLCCFLYNLGSMFARTKATAIWQASWRHRTNTHEHTCSCASVLGPSECCIFLFCFFCHNSDLFLGKKV